MFCFRTPPAGLLLAALTFSLCGGCDRPDQAIHACTKDLRTRSTVREYMDGAVECAEAAKTGLANAYSLSSQQLSKIGVEAPTLEFEHLDGFNFNTGIAMPSLGIEFTLTNTAGVPISNVTYLVEIVGDGRLIGSAQLTSHLLEALQPGQSGHVKAPIEIGTSRGDWRELQRARHISTHIRLLQAQ